MNQELAMIGQRGGARRARRAAWGVVLERWRESGLGVREFCRQYGLRDKRFFAWRKKLESASPAGRAGFVELSLLPPAVEAPLELQLGEARVLLRGGCEASLLRMLLGVLREGSC